LLQLVLLAAFLVFNYFLLRWLVRQLVIESEWLRDPDMRAEVLRRNGPDQLRGFLGFGSNIPFSKNPIALLVSNVAVIYGVLWADYAIIREQWPWLLGG
jgi:hypothetical protein